ncbi:MAG: class IV adenylate cyclase [Pyrinomonadaceae bacterium]|nr:class IV adenylate cyclase [Pyrinomonadaceae bacterium]
MAIEIEKKYRLTADQYAAVEEELNFFGAEFRGEDFEENTLYGGGRLAKDGSILRIRKTGTRSILTYKRRIKNTDSIKQTIEYETGISDPESMAQIVDLLGFEKTLIYEKRRKTWNFRSVEVVLDVLPFGVFMEIEGTVENIREAEFMLSACDFEVEHETYPMLTTKLGKKEGSLIVSRFS